MWHVATCLCQKESWPRQKLRNSLLLSMNSAFLVDHHCKTSIRMMPFCQRCTSKNCNLVNQESHSTMLLTSKIFVFTVVRNFQVVPHWKNTIHNVNSVKTRTRYLETSQRRRAKEVLCFLRQKFIFDLLPVRGLLNDDVISVALARMHYRSKPGREPTMRFVVA